MAKRYDTQEDFQRDVLKDQAQNLRLSAERQSGWGATLVGMSFLGDLLNSGPVKRGWLGVASSVVGIIGIIESVRAWFTHSKAHNLELERERLGPEQIVLPSEMGGHSADAALTPCEKKKFADAVNAQSLMEQAAREQAPMARV
jgi:hypothetical protein